MENPQEARTTRTRPGMSRTASTTGLATSSSSDIPSHDLKRIKKKPSRTLLYIRHRANASNISIILVGTILIVLTIHRLFSLYMTNRQWVNAPITYMPRTCPTTYDYETIHGTTTTTTASRQQVMTTKTERHLQDTSLNGTTAAVVATSIVSQQREPFFGDSHPHICLTTLTDSYSPSLLQRFFRWRNYDSIMGLTHTNKEHYAQKHGYTFFDASKFDLDTTRPPAWSKIPAVLHLLRNKQNENAGDNTARRKLPHCDWVMWTDADTVIMNSNVSMQDFLPTDSSAKDFVVASDNGGGYNSGVFVFRNTPWSIQFLERWWNMTSYVRPPGFSLSGDNNALKALLRELQDTDEFDRKVAVPPRCTMNSFAQFLTLQESTTLTDMKTISQQEWYMSIDYYHQGDFIAHTPGYDNKAECLRLLLQEAK